MIAFPVLLVVMFLQEAAAQLPATDGNALAGAKRGFEPAAKPYEIIRFDSAWCGPRVLYFFACYLRKECTLDEVVGLCRTDADGVTSLRDLVEAARTLGLEPTPIRCDPEQVLAAGGPAVLCVRGAGNSHPESDEPVHFIGLVGRKEGDYFWVIDPARDVVALSVHRDVIAEAFTGHALLLKGCPQPSLHPWWLSFPGVLLPTAFAVLLPVGLFRLWHLRARRLSGKG